MKFLYYAPLSWGGMAEYSHHQAAALARSGVEVTMLCPANGQGPWHRIGVSQLPYTLRPVLQGWRVRTLPAPLRKLLFARDLLLDVRTLAKVIWRERFPSVLFATYSEHFAPLWAGSLRRLTQERGTVFGAVVHDPERTSGIGPRWWHRRSVAAKYSALREAFVHSPMTLDTILPMPALRTTVIPQGIYEAPPANVPRANWRAMHRLPLNAKVMLSFGHIRDNKNLDLVLQAMRSFPDLYLVVSGKEQSTGQKNADFYHDLSRELGVADRCRWLIGFIPDEEISDIFVACDLLLLTYSRTFHSASAVLNLAANFRIPCLASGGESNLGYVVQQYNLGVWLEPDSVDRLIVGIEAFLHGTMPAPRWQDYENDNSWERNAELVAEKMRNLEPVVARDARA